MKEIIINEKNAEKISGILEEVQGRCSQRTVTAKDVLKMPGRIKEAYRIPLKALEGCVFKIDLNAQNFPRAYKYNPSSTIVEITVRGGKYRLTQVYRDTTFPDSHNVKAFLSVDAKIAIIDRATECRI